MFVREMVVARLCSLILCPCVDHICTSGVHLKHGSIICKRSSAGMLNNSASVFRGLVLCIVLLFPCSSYRGLLDLQTLSRFYSEAHYLDMGQKACLPIQTLFTVRVARYEVNGAVSVFRFASGWLSTIYY